MTPLRTVAKAIAKGNGEEWHAIRESKRAHYETMAEYAIQAMAMYLTGSLLSDGEIDDNAMPTTGDIGGILK